MERLRISLLFLIFFILNSIFYGMEQEKTRLCRIFDGQGDRNLVLSALLKAFNLNPTNDQELVGQTQATWLRTPDRERWEAENPYESRKAELMSLFKKMDLISAVNPFNKHYDYILILGALHSRVKMRMEHVRKLWEEGIRFNEIVALGCERKLDAHREPSSLFVGTIPTTEYEMMKYVWNNLVKPVDLERVKITFLNTPHTIGFDGKEVRATTATTILDWLSRHPKPGTCLVISNQPFVHYQTNVVRALMPKEFTVYAAGMAADEGTVRMSDILDSLARWIYIENQLRCKNATSG